MHLYMKGNSYQGLNFQNIAYLGMGDTYKSFDGVNF